VSIVPTDFMLAANTVKSNIKKGKTRRQIVLTKFFDVHWQ